MTRLGALAATVLVVAYAWWVSGLEPFSGGATAAVVGAGGAAVVVGRRARRRDPEGAQERAVPVAALVAWGGLVAALAAWQLTAFVQEPRSEHPTISSLANAALEPRPVRAAAFVAWLGGAAWLAR